VVELTVDMKVGPKKKRRGKRKSVKGGPSFAVGGRGERENACMVEKRQMGGRKGDGGKKFSSP